MKFIFNSVSECGRTIEMDFDEEHIDDIRAFFNDFLRGSGFHFEDEEEQISVTTDNDEISDTADNTWIGMSDVEVAAYSEVYSGIRLARMIEAQLKERNNG